MLAAKETFAASGIAHGAVSSSTHPNFHPPVARVLQHHRHNNFKAFGAFWPGYGYFYGPSNDEPILDVPASGSIPQPSAYDVPWDWAHRYPAAPGADAAHAPGCSEETVTTRRQDGREHTVNVLRCY
jgi:hypothetical protein